MSPIVKGKIFDSAILNGVSVVTAVHNNKRGGCTASWFSQVSYSPVLLMVSLSPKRHTYEIIKKSTIFNINILSGEQLDIARHFGLTSGHSSDKFDNIVYSAGANGAPILPNLKALAECRLIKELVAGDHTLLIAEVISFTEDKAKTPLQFIGGDYW